MKKLSLLLIVIAVLLSGLSIVSAQDDMGIDSAWWQAAGAPYAGTVLHGVTESTPPSNYVKDVLAPMFQEMTGIQVDLETTSWDQMYDKAIRDMEAGSGIYDFVYIEQDIIYGYLANNYLVDMTQALSENPDLAAPGFSFDDFTSFLNYFKNADGDVFGMPMEAFVKVYLYRTDLFENADNQAAFEAEYGYPLAPATTHQQYTDIAKFFTEYGEANDMDLWGTTVQAASGHPSSFYEFFESVAPTFGVYNWGINMENWKATVENGGEMNSDAAKEALAWWLGNLQYAPPESTSSTWDEVAASFAAGRAAQGLVYGENAAWIATDPERSTVVGNVGVALPPLSDGVLAAAEAGDGYIGYYDGGAFGLPVSSQNVEATLLWLQFVGLPQVQEEWAATSSRIVMDSTYSTPMVVEVDAATNGYFSLMKDEGYLFAGAPPFPFHPQVREVVAPFIYQAIGGELTAAEALDQAAAAADAELVSLGYGS
ncbi:MAG: extracellular solute-binding protein [Anaerolineae bacterium]|nr:extracellular solute-binding protein [Anaerolineae bacterium]